MFLSGVSYSVIRTILRKNLSSKSPALWDRASDLKAHQEKLMARGLPKRRSIPGVKNVLLVASGKGGVGKSTTAVNLALSLSKLSRGGVGILDADVFGPSIPIMLHLEGKPGVTSDKKMVPLTNYGLQCMSMGFLVDPEQAVVWRGPMVMGAIEKMIHQTAWKDLEYLVVDLPPGTGDIHLSIAQTLQVTGAIVVSTPQKVALADARKGVTMFDKVDIPVLGLVENMSSFVCGNCQEVTPIFGEGGGKEMARKLNIELLGEIPLDPNLMRSSDEGQPIVVSHPSSRVAQTYSDIAEKVANSISVA